MNPLWLHQEEGIAAVLNALKAGVRRPLLTSPTGMGKSRMVCEIIDQVAGWGWKAVVYSNRKLLVEQLVAVLAAHGIECGVRAAGWSDRNSDLPVQVSSLPTEKARVIDKEIWSLHGLGRNCLAVVDEAHINNGGVAREIMRRHIEAGHSILGVTATPLDLGGSYDVLIQAGTTSQGRACGALVPALHYGCTEPDLKLIGRVLLGEDLSETQNKRAIMVEGIFGHVFDWFEKLNPEHKPTILFAPGVGESLWFAEQFHKKGISAAHIDGQEVWVNGKYYRSDRGARQDVLDGSRDGRVKLLCNRFVLREGIDCPWLAHGIMATVFGSLQSYLQSGGRLLRAFPGMECVTVQDHGGNWWRHGSLNADRTWELDFTGAVVAGLREQRLRDKVDAEPVRCPKCGLVLSRAKCPCGYEIDLKKKARPVLQADGSLREMRGDIFWPQTVSTAPDGPKKWERVYWRSVERTITKKNGEEATVGKDRTFRAAMALFFVENGSWPNKSWPLMPLQAIDEFRKVRDVPFERLVPKR